MGTLGAGGAAYDPVTLEESAKRYWREAWSMATYDTIVDERIDLARFGPVQAAIVAEEFAEPTLNFILGADAPGAVEAGHLADAVEWLGSHGVDHRIPLRAGSSASTAERWLSRRGYEQDEAGVTKFLRDTSPPDFAAPAGIEVAELDDDHDQNETLADLMAAGLGHHRMWTFFYGIQGYEDWRAFVTTDAESVGSHSCALMLVHDGVAELGSAAPMEAETPSGGDCQVALLRHCILEAAAAGCRLIAAEAPEPDPEEPSTSWENLLEAGFEPAFACHDWQPPREAVEAERKRRLRWAG